MRSRETNRLIAVGVVNPLTNDKFHQRNIVYDENGISPTQTSTQYKDAIRVLVRENNYENGK